MADPFARGNNAVISESGLYLELAKTATETPTAAPSLATDGASLDGAARCLLAVAGGTAMDAIIWLYLGFGTPAAGWRRAHNATLTVEASGGVVERFNCAGATRVYIQASAANTSAYHIARSIT